MPGLDGQKMSKSYGNTISLREEPRVGGEEDPHHADRSGAREAHRSGQSGEMPGVALHLVYSDEETQEVGAARAAPPPASAAWNASSR